MNFTIDSEQALIEAVRTYGILPFFANSLPGFSVEEHTPARLWLGDVVGPWEWKGPVIRATGCAYGKFFENKAAFVSRDVFLDLANYRRDGYDFDARFDDELASYRDKALYDLVEGSGPILTGDLKKLGNYRKDGNKGFDAIMTRLQAQCYIVVSDFEYARDRHGNEYGWGVSKYATPEQTMGKAFAGKVYRRTPEVSFERLVKHIRKLVPEAGRKDVERFLTRGAAQSRTAYVREWLVPSNPKYFDIVGAFAESDEIIWKQGNDNIHVGDTVYMYVGAPYSAILYRCAVTETDIPFHGVDEHVNVKKVMKIRKLAQYDPSLVNMEELRKYNIVTVRCTRSMDAALAADLAAGTLR